MNSLLSLLGNKKTGEETTYRTISYFRRIKLAAAPPGGIIQTQLFELPRIDKNSMLIEASAALKTSQDTFTTYPELIFTGQGSCNIPIVIDEGIRVKFFTFVKIPPRTKPVITITYEGGPEYIDIVLNLIQYF